MLLKFHCLPPSSDSQDEEQPGVHNWWLHRPAATAPEEGGKSGDLGKQFPPCGRPTENMAEEGEAILLHTESDEREFGR